MTVCARARLCMYGNRRRRRRLLPPDGKYPLNFNGVVFLSPLFFSPEKKGSCFSGNSADLCLFLLLFVNRYNMLRARSFPTEFLFVFFHLILLRIIIISKQTLVIALTLINVCACVFFNTLQLK